jgi:hypothetical protein
LIAISKSNLKAFWSTFASHGYRRLVLSGVMASLPLNEPWIAEAVPGSTITFVRLSASEQVREQRLRGREIGSDFERALRSSNHVAALIEANDPPGVSTVSTDARSVDDVARLVLDAAGWP